MRMGEIFDIRRKLELVEFSERLSNTKFDPTIVGTTQRPSLFNPITQQMLRNVSSSLKKARMLKLLYDLNVSSHVGVFFISIENEKLSRDKNETKRKQFFCFSRSVFLCCM